jgi:hypothetical protein
LRRGRRGSELVRRTARRSVDAREEEERGGEQGKLRVDVL